MTYLCSQHYLGDELQKKLNLAGIDSAKELTITGSEKAFIRLKTIEPDASIIPFTHWKAQYSEFAGMVSTSSGNRNYWNFSDDVNKYLHFTTCPSATYFYF